MESAPAETMLPKLTASPRVMIGAAGTATAFGIARTLRTTWPDAVEIVVADVRPRRLIGAAMFAEEYVESPPVADPGYQDWLERALRETGATLYVPLIDADIVAAVELAEAGRCEARVAAPPLSSARICWDKIATYEWLRREGLPTPGTWDPGEAPRGEASLVAKSRSGQGSVGFRPLAGAAELEALPSGDGLVVQEACSPPEVTIDVFNAADGSAFRAICRERIEVKAGVCTKARVFESGELAGLAERVATPLGLSGFCMQVMCDGGGDWTITDLNARPGAGARLSTAAGVDVLGAVYADLTGLPFDLEARTMRRLEDDVYVIRQFDEHIIE